MHARKGHTPMMYFGRAGVIPFEPSPPTTHPRCPFVHCLIGPTVWYGINPTPALLQVYGDFYKLFKNSTFIGRPSAN